MAADHTTAIFVAQLILLLLVGRLMGEVMARIGQPAIFGQLLAGVLLGPSVFGALLPGLHHLVFPDTPTLKAMINAVSQVGIMLLLLLTGMETDLSQINRKRLAVVSGSVFGIAVPFACGVGLAYALPPALIPSQVERLVTALFLGTALSISSVKIVAMVLMEIGAIRRDLGQLILATAILDDTLAWIIIAIITGIAADGVIDFRDVGTSLAFTGLFLVASFMVGRRIVARIILWCNDNMAIEMPVISAILIVMFAMALTTDLIGVHAALGAFVAGILIGQSPFLTEHIENQLRGFIIAFFSPVFFAVAGLGMDLRTLLDPTLLMFTLAIIAVASVGKFLGALAGGRIGGLTVIESLALATGLNARGSTEVIIASIGLSIGALSGQLYTMIVAMAVVTTMIMPPTLRWMMARVPLREEETRRLDNEEAERRQALPHMERALVHVDASPNGELMASVAGLFAARQNVLTTLLEAPGDAGTQSTVLASHERWLAAARSASVNGSEASSSPPSGGAASAPHALVQARAASGDALVKEIAKGYDIAFVGVSQPLSAAGPRFEEPLHGLVDAFDGPVVIVMNAASRPISPGTPLNILVPADGRADTRLATEIALTLAGATRGALTALHVFDPRENTLISGGRPRRAGMSVLVEAHRLGKRGGVAVRGLTATNLRPDIEIRRAVRRGRYDLVVLGASLRHGEAKFLGTRMLALVQSLPVPVLLVAR
ncbi:MAG: cation:proton antiporter [Reyranella sp.]|uniref:cation:proton antiporter domain-containing protein n=1 Tax=Reyranella sp. TaxID=1929291 RepID=UPI003D0F1C00